MKKVLISLFSIALLLSACGSEEDVAKDAGKQGTLVAKINFADDEMSPRTAQTTAIPTTDWTNVKQMQMFLYKADGTVAFSAIITPSTASSQTFTWTNIPQGSYELSLVANINSAPGKDDIATSLDGGSTWTPFTAYNPVNKKINTELFIDLKPSVFPTGHIFESGDAAYSQTSEIFTAYKSSVSIVEGQATDLSAQPLQLKREISLMRVRIDKTDKPDSAPALSSVDFAHANNFIAIHTMPKGLGLKLGTTFDGGVFATSDKNRIMIAASGTGTYNSTEMTSGYSINPTDMMHGNFKLWKDIKVLPNASRAEGKTASADADPGRKYFIVISGWAPAGYVYADESVAPAAQPVYWSGTINGVFSPNVIREVNLTISSKGYSTNPLNPEENGGLIITVNAPENWSNVIESEDREI